MIKRKKGKPPASLVDPKWDLTKQAALDDKNDHEVDLKCYRDCTLDSLLKLYEGKCAYCERSRGDEVNIDHYRPKKKRANLKNVIYNQPGYYWLPYTWSNLLPLCSKCNQFKSNKFPLVGFNETNRISSHEKPIGILNKKRFNLLYLNKTENPFLLNPEDEPLEFKDHFAFNKEGNIAGKTVKGQETINICKLDRKNLRLERAKHIFNYVELINKQLDKYLNANKAKPNKEEILETSLFVVFEMIYDNCNSSKDFSLLGLYIYHYFDDIIVPKLNGTKKRALIKKAFKKFKLSLV